MKQQVSPEFRRAPEAEIKRLSGNPLSAELTRTAMYLLSIRKVRDAEREIDKIKREIRKLYGSQPVIFRAMDNAIAVFNDRNLSPDAQGEKSVRALGKAVDLLRKLERS